MAEEMELSNGSPLKERHETAVMIHLGTAETHIPGKTFPSRMYNLRNLAIASIICGCSCIGILALIYALKAREKQKANSDELAAHWAQKSQCMSCLSIGIWVSLLLLVPLLILLLSYVFSQAE